MIQKATGVSTARVILLRQFLYPRALDKKPVIKPIAVSIPSTYVISIHPMELPITVRMIERLVLLNTGSCAGCPLLPRVFLYRRIPAINIMSTAVHIGRKPGPGAVSMVYSMRIACIMIYIANSSMRRQEIIFARRIKHTPLSKILGEG
jgi:hypothetical protein